VPSLVTLVGLLGIHLLLLIERLLLVLFKHGVSIQNVPLAKIVGDDIVSLWDLGAALLMLSVEVNILSLGLLLLSGFGALVLRWEFLLT